MQPLCMMQSCTSRVWWRDACDGGLQCVFSRFAPQKLCSQTVPGNCALGTTTNCAERSLRGDASVQLAVPLQPEAGIAEVPCKLLLPLNEEWSFRTRGSFLPIGVACRCRLVTSVSARTPRSLTSFTAKHCCLLSEQCASHRGLQIGHEDQSCQ